MAHAIAAADDHHRTWTGVSNWKLGFWTFIASECLFFGTLISTYMVYKGRAVVGPYPEDIFNILLTTTSTTILLFSSLAMVLALDAVNRARKGLAIFWLGMVMLMGLAFIGIELYEYMHFIHEGLTVTSSTFGSSYYVVTGTHKLHVLVGVIWMGTLAWLIHKDRIPPEKSEQVEVAGLYWHFVDVIWIVIFTLVYLIS
ncbi:MAG: cytochrome c oxidase subunit 3 [Gemmatimonadota bacterium]